MFKLKKTDNYAYYDLYDNDDLEDFDDNIMSFNIGKNIRIELCERNKGGGTNSNKMDIIGPHSETELGDGYWVNSISAIILHRYDKS